MPDISIVVPFFNDKDVVERLFHFTEPYKNHPRVEIIFLDDASDDNTAQLLEEGRIHGGYKNLVILKNEINRGPAFTRNRGILIARGEYIAFLDSDDGWAADKIWLQHDLMKKYQADLSGTLYQIRDPDSYKEAFSDPLPDNEENLVRKLNFARSLFRCPFPTPSILVRKVIIEKYLFDTRLRTCEDYNLWLKLIRNHNAIRIELPLTCTFKHDFISKEKSLLSENIWKSQINELKNYLYLWKEPWSRVHDKCLITSAIVLSFLKFIRRMLLLKLSFFRKSSGFMNPDKAPEFPKSKVKT